MKRISLQKRKITKIAVYLSLAIICVGLILSDGPLFAFFSLLLWFWLLVMVFFLFSLFFNAFIESVTKPLDGRSSNTKFSARFHLSEKNRKKIYSICKYFLTAVFTAVVIISALTIQMALLTHWKAEQNIPEFEDLVTSLIECRSSNESKTKALLTWFDNKTGNIYNDWRLRNHLFFRLDGGMIKFYTTFPYITVRTYDDKDALWILTSQFGHCGEYSNLYRKMADYAGLRVRKVSADGENHCWNEVFVNNTTQWKIVDPTNVFIDEDKNGYDGVNLSWLKNKLGGNFSHVVGQEIGGKYINITGNYTTEINITVLTVNNNGEPISSATVKLLSNSRDVGRDTGLKGVTNSSGQYTFTIGIGNYTFKVSKDNYYGENTSIFGNEKLHHDFRIVLEEK